MYDVAGKKPSLKDIAWLIFCGVQIPANVALVLIRHFTSNTNTFYWYVWLLCLALHAQSVFRGFWLWDTRFWPCRTSTPVHGCTSALPRFRPFRSHAFVSCCRSPINIFFTQLLTVGVFIYYR